MRFLSAVSAILMSLFSGWQGLATDLMTRSKQVSEAEVRDASARVYSELLLQASRKGWRYTPSAIENGYERHFQELKLQLAAQGYTIVPDDRDRTSAER